MSDGAGGPGQAEVALDDELRRLGTSRRALAVAAWERWRAEVVREAAAGGQAVGPTELGFDGFHFVLSGGADWLAPLRALPDGAGAQAALAALFEGAEPGGGPEDA